ncbi:hypothetical protein [Winogradskyella sp.]|uniref:hypothetical protein n=1 Tax=Winogradskyella sp. TaxID=1883156 RepID=UPI00260CEFF2|nr:hypothetical protein [Winogradskyella sp.]
MDNKAFELLRKLIESNEEEFSEESGLNFDIREDFDYYRQSLAALKRNDLIVYVGKFKFTVTKEGYKVAKYKNWSSYIDEKQKKELRTDKKEYYDYLFSKYRYKTFWILFVLAIFGGVYSAYDFIERLTTKGDSEIEQKSLPENKSEPSEQEKLIIDSKKQADSVKLPVGN